MKKFFFMLVGAMALMLLVCSNKMMAGFSDTKEVAAQQQEQVKGPATIDLESFSVKVPKGWYVKSQRSNSCELEPLVKPNIDHKSNFGWRVEIYALAGNVFKPEKFIATDKSVFEDTKEMPELTIGKVTYLYNFYDYEYGKHSLLAASLPSGGAVEITIGGYAVEDAPVKAILKSLKLK